MRLLALLFASTLVAAPISVTSFPPELSSELNAVVDRYVAATKAQREAMLGAQMEMDIDGRFTKLREQGRMRVLRMIDKLGDLTFSVIDFVGDNRIKTELIARYMETEQKEKAFGALTISPENYEFKIAAILKTDGRSIYIFDVNARKKDASAFRGEVWVDGETGMPLREEGRLLKSPHILLRNVRMTRDYELRDGISIVKHFRSTTDVRLLGVGTAVLDISFSNFSRSAPEQRAPKDLQ